jgi:MGT family glycosyltransferase
MTDIISNTLQRRGQEGGNREASIMSELFFGPLVRGEILDTAVAELQPDVMLILAIYPVEGLAVYYRYRLPVVFFRPILRDDSRAQVCESLIGALLDLRSGAAELLEIMADAGVRLRSLSDLTHLVLRMPELVLLPAAFNPPGRGEEPGEYYIGAGVDIARREEPFPWADIDSDRPLIYCARGSQTKLQKETSRRFFQLVIESAAARPDWQFIVAIGKIFDAKDFPSIPSNVLLYRWAPQLEVLSRANVMINHGGFGTVKECILMGVPMVILPQMNFRDHYCCTERVAYHGLGVYRDLARATSNEVVSLIEQVINDPSFKYRIGLMQEKFKQQDRLDLAVKVIENAIANDRESVSSAVEPPPA